MPIQLQRISFVVVIAFFIAITACSTPAPDSLTTEAEKYVCDDADVNACVDAFTQGCKDGGGVAECTELGESHVLDCTCKKASSAQSSSIDEIASGPPEAIHHCPGNDNKLNCFLA